MHLTVLTCTLEWYLYTCCLSCCLCCKFCLLAVAEEMNLVTEHAIVVMPSQCTDCNCDLVNIAEQKAVTTPIKVAIPTEVNRKAFPESPGGLISPGDNSTVYEPDRQATFSGCLKTNHIVRRPLRPQRHFKGCCSPIC